MADATTTEKKETQNTPPPATGPSSEKGVVAPKIITEEEFTEKVLNVHAENGRLKKELVKVTKERDDLRSQADRLSQEVKDATQNLTETKGRIEDLEADLTQAIEGNADLTEINKIKRSLRDAKVQAETDLKAKRDAIEAEKKALTAEREQWATTVAEAQAMKFEVDVFEVAEEHEGLTSERLKALCEKTGKTTRAEIEDLADTLWVKKEGTTLKTSLKGDSGITTGGGVNWASLTPKQRLEETSKRLRVKG